MHVREHHEKNKKRYEFLEIENKALNKHKGELIEKIWFLESKIRMLEKELNK